MTELEKATFYIVGYVDGNFAAIGLRDDMVFEGTTETDQIEPEESDFLHIAMLKRIRQQYTTLTDADIETAYSEASLNTVAYIPTPASKAKMAEATEIRLKEFRDNRKVTETE